MEIGNFSNLLLFKEQYKLNYNMKTNTVILSDFLFFTLIFYMIIFYFYWLFVRFLLLYDKQFNYFEDIIYV